jgi:SAM-dependent methyltransferase
MRCSRIPSTRSWTIPRKFRNVAAAVALAALFPLTAQATLQTDPNALTRTMKAAFDRGAANGWHFADDVYYFSTVLDAGRAYELVRRDDPDNLKLEGTTLDIAAKLHYDPLINRDAAEWYVRAAAGAYADDPTRGPAAKALLLKLELDDANPAHLAQDGDADATLNAAAAPNDVEALLEQVDADLRAYLITTDTHYRSLALLRAAQPGFPIGLVPDDTGKPLWAAAEAARSGATGYSDVDRQAAVAMYSHKASAKVLATIGRVLSHNAYLVITAPADEYFGQTKLSPIGVRNELARIGKYLDAGWGNRMTKDTLWVIDSLEDWEHQYPRDYELPRLLLQTFKTLGRMDSPEAQKAEADVRRTLTVDYNGTTEARSILMPG